VYREVEHTADYSVQLAAEDLEGLFVQSIQAVEALCGVEEEISALEQKTINLRAADLETLLVEWLEEYLYSLEVESQTWRSMEIRINKCELQAFVQISALKSIQKVIKAVTFHELAVIRKGSKWEATVVFDV